MSEIDCRRCKRWQGCIGRLYYDFSEIRWCPLQVIWLIQNWDILEKGQWPQPADFSEGAPNVQTEGNFVKSAIIMAELKTRLERTRVDGKLLKSEVWNYGDTDLEAVDIMNRLDRDAYTALMYVKGFRRKKMFYLDWRRKAKYRNRTCTQSYTELRQNKGELARK